MSLYVWRLFVSPRGDIRLFKKKGKQEKRAEPERGLVVFPVLLQALPDPNVRLKLPLDLSATDSAVG